MDTSTIVPLFFPSVLCICLFTALLFSELIRYPDPEIDIETTPKNQGEMRTAKELLTHKLKTQRNMFTLLLIPFIIPILYLHTKLYTSNATALIIAIATVLLLFPIAYYTSKAAIAAYLEIFQPMPKEHAQQLLEWCAKDKICDQYRLAVLSQGRYITLAEYKNAEKWIEKRKEKEKTELQEKQHKRLYQSKPIA